MELIDPSNLSVFDLSNSVNLQGKHFPEGTIAVLTIKGFCRTPCSRPNGNEVIMNAIAFVEVDKPMVLNETKLAELKKICGPVVREWIGRKIALRQGSTMMGGEMKSCIVVQAPPKDQNIHQQVAALAAPTTNEFDEFMRWKAQQTQTATVQS